MLIIQIQTCIFVFIKYSGLRHQYESLFSLQVAITVRLYMKTIHKVTSKTKIVQENVQEQTAIFMAR